MVKENLLNIEVNIRWFVRFHEYIGTLSYLGYSNSIFRNEIPRKTFRNIDKNKIGAKYDHMTSETDIEFSKMMKMKHVEQSYWLLIHNSCEFHLLELGLARPHIRCFEILSRYNVCVFPCELNNDDTNAVSE